MISFQTDNIKIKRVTCVLIFYLVAALLSLQWSASHIHLATLHDHNDELHYHSIEVHSHELNIHHADSIEVTHYDNHGNVIEINHDTCLQKNEKQQSIALINSVDIYQISPPSLPEYQFSSSINLKPDDLHRYSIYLRAPPVFS